MTFPPETCFFFIKIINIFLKHNDIIASNCPGTNSTDQQGKLNQLILRFCQIQHVLMLSVCSLCINFKLCFFFYCTFTGKSGYVQGDPGKLKELSFCHKLKCYNLYIFATRWCKPMIFQT